MQLNHLVLIAFGMIIGYLFSIWKQKRNLHSFNHHRILYHFGLHRLDYNPEHELLQKLKNDKTFSASERLIAVNEILKRIDHPDPDWYLLKAELFFILNQERNAQEIVTIGLTKIPDKEREKKWIFILSYLELWKNYQKEKPFPHIFIEALKVYPLIPETSLTDTQNFLLGCLLEQAKDPVKALAYYKHAISALKPLKFDQIYSLIHLQAQIDPFDALVLLDEYKNIKKTSFEQHLKWTKLKVQIYEYAGLSDKGCSIFEDFLLLCITFDEQQMTLLEYARYVFGLGDVSKTQELCEKITKTELKSETKNLLQQASNKYKSL